MDWVGLSFMIKNRHAPTCAHGRPMASTTGCLAEAKGWARGDTGRSSLHRCRAVSSKNRHAVARPTGALRTLEVRLQPIRQLGEEGALGDDLQGTAVGGR